MSRLEYLKQQLEKINRLMAELNRMAKLENPCPFTYSGATVKNVKSTTQSSEQLTTGTESQKESVLTALQMPDSPGCLPRVQIDGASATSRAEKQKQKRTEDNERLLREFGLKKK